ASTRTIDDRGSVAPWRWRCATTPRCGAAPACGSLSTRTTSRRSRCTTPQAPMRTPPRASSGGTCRPTKRACRPMSWTERMLEERLASAAANGELSAPHLEGKPLPDIDRQRSQGWWAEQFAARELSHDRRERAVVAAAQARAGFWRAASLDELRE